MTNSTYKIDQIEARRDAVAHWRLRGKTLKQIALAIIEDGFVATDGGPLCQKTIQKDLVAVRKIWKDDYLRDYDDHVAEMAAKYGECFKALWDSDNPKEAAMILDKIARLLGLNAPERKQLHLSGGLDVTERAALADSARAKIETLVRGRLEAVDEQKRIENEEGEGDDSE